MTPTTCACVCAAEIQPQETRAAGQALATFVQNVFNFLLGQTFLSMLCTMVRPSWGRGLGCKH